MMYSCDKCGVRMKPQQINRSGKCKACRTTTCKLCKKEFLPCKVEKDICSACLASQLRKQTNTTTQIGQSGKDLRREFIERQLVNYGCCLLPRATLKDGNDLLRVVIEARQKRNWIVGKSHLKKDFDFEVQHQSRNALEGRRKKRAQVLP